ncbi:MAG: hypothetical protein RBR08_14555 [Desulforegulaceae bacterium]|nr:hypothetical protein [Desulforegulaceae bacterium]
MGKIAPVRALTDPRLLGIPELCEKYYPEIAPVSLGLEISLLFEAKKIFKNDSDTEEKLRRIQHGSRFFLW